MQNCGMNLAAINKEMNEAPRSKLHGIQARANKTDMVS
jgi:hypothetical protein